MDASRSIEAVKYMSKSWDIFCGLCVPNTHYPHEPIFKSRQFMFMLSDFRLINSDLSPKEVLQILAKDNPELAQEDFCNLELEMTFLEFLEALIDCATVYVTEAVLKRHLSPKDTPVPSSRSQSAASFTPATSKPGIDSPDEGKWEKSMLLLRKWERWWGFFSPEFPAAHSWVNFLFIVHCLTSGWFKKRRKASRYCLSFTIVSYNCIKYIQSCTGNVKQNSISTLLHFSSQRQCSKFIILYLFALLK